MRPTSNDLVEVSYIMRALEPEVVDATGQRSNRCYRHRIGPTREEGTPGDGAGWSANARWW